MADALSLLFWAILPTVLVGWRLGNLTRVTSLLLHTSTSYQKQLSGKCYTGTSASRNSVTQRSTPHSHQKIRGNKCAFLLVTLKGITMHYSDTKIEVIVFHFNDKAPKILFSEHKPARVIAAGKRMNRKPNEKFQRHEATPWYFLVPC